MMTINNIQDNAPKIWGIINITPDSFSDGNMYYKPEKAYIHMQELNKEGAHFFDVGAASSRPFAPFIEEEEEWQRLKPFFDVIQKEDKNFLSRISVDTWRASVAEKALERGVFCINDISGFRWDKKLLEVLIEYQPYYILMHSLDIPAKMQKNIEERKDKNIVQTVYNFFEERLEILEKNAYPKEKIILDIGIGFGKTVEQNFELLNAAEKFIPFGYSLMSAISRKSLLSNFLDVDKKNNIELDRASAIMSLLLEKQGFKHHRVHNVRAIAQAFALDSKLKQDETIC